MATLEGTEVFVWRDNGGKTQRLQIPAKSSPLIQPPETGAPPPPPQTTGSGVPTLPALLLRLWTPAPPACDPRGVSALTRGQSLSCSSAAADAPPTVSTQIRR